MLSRHDDTVVRNRFDLQASRNDDGLLEFTFLLAETEIELVSGALVDGQRSKLATESAHGRQTVEERLHGRFIINRLEVLLRSLDGIRDRRQAFREGLRRPRAGVSRQAGHARVDAIKERRLVFFRLPG